MLVPKAGDEELLNVRDVRRELGGISGELVRKLLRAGAFPNAFKVGADWFAPASDVTDDLRYRYGPGGPNRHRGPVRGAPQRKREDRERAGGAP